MSDLISRTDTILSDPRVKALVEALRSTLNFIENTEGEMGVILGCGDKARAALARILRAVPSVLPGEPVAIRHSWDGHGWHYIDCGSGSDWVARGMTYPDAEPLYV